jgi:hypothetical protein
LRIFNRKELVDYDQVYIDRLSGFSTADEGQIFRFYGWQSFLPDDHSRIPFHYGWRKTKNPHGFSTMRIIL